MKKVGNSLPMTTDRSELGLPEIDGSCGIGNPDPSKSDPLVRSLGCCARDMMIKSIFCIYGEISVCVCR